MSATQPIACIDASAAQKFEKALSLHRRGNLREAERLYQAILASDREHFGSVVHLGLICLQDGRLDEAEALFREALDRNPNSADAHANLANARLALNRIEDAVARYERALAIDPDHAEANFGLASALHGLQRHEDAITRYEKALAIDPDYAEANYGIATALQALKRYDKAILFYEKALAVDPEYAEANYGIATALQALNRHDRAIGFYEKALAVDPSHVEANDGLGTALRALDRHDEAIPFYERALATRPGYGAAHNNLGVTLQQMGRLDEARLAFERAVGLEPRRPGFYCNLFDTKKITVGDRHLAALEALVRDAASLPGDDRIQLHFALGKALADVGEHQRSFDHFLEGNALKRRQVEHDEAAAMRMFERIRAVFGAELMRSKAGQGDPSSLPVFILGMPRSGSTLIEQILASHPKILGGGERLDLRDALNSFGEAASVALPFPEVFVVATGEELRRLGTGYLDRLNAAAGAADLWQRITDKMPANFRLVGLIHLALPNARIVHTCRDPVDTCLSCFSTLFGGDQPFAYDLGELGRYYRFYSSLMEHWRRVLPEGVMLDVQYEELIADFEPQARRMVAHCGLEWHDACRAYDKTTRPVKTASSAQVRRPIYRSSVGRWRPDADTLKPLLDGLGPDLAGGRPGGGDNHQAARPAATGSRRSRV
jgi:tetratricopeptide (TPR) repeat protein